MIHQVMTLLFQGHHLPVPQKPLRTLAAVRLARGRRTMCVFSQDVVDRNGTTWISWNVLRGITNHFHIFCKMIFWYFIFSIEGHTVHILFQPLSSYLTSFYSAQVLGVPLESIYLKSSELDSGKWWTMGFPIGWKLGKSTFWKRHGNA